MSLIIISGPTASGKSYLAEEVCSKIGTAKIINADSLQVYNALPILTAQPKDLLSHADQYSLYSCFAFDDKCTVAKWVNLVLREISNVISKGSVPILVGGTGLYIKSLLDGVVEIPEIENSVKQKIRNDFFDLGKALFYEKLVTIDPEIKSAVHFNDASRMMRAMEVFVQTGKSILEFKNQKTQEYSGSYTHVSFFPEREQLYRWCEGRFDTMLKSGVLGEVESLKKLLNGRRVGDRYSVECALGYRELCGYIDGEVSLEDALCASKQQTRNYAKRQITWFKNQFNNSKSVVYSSLSDALRQLFNLISV